MYISANTITSTITKIEVQLHKSDIDANWVNQAPVSAFCEQKKYNYNHKYKYIDRSTSR